MKNNIQKEIQNPFLGAIGVPQPIHTDMGHMHRLPKAKATDVRQGIADQSNVSWMLAFAHCMGHHLSHIHLMSRSLNNKQTNKKVS
jgi:hypothetical protein